DTLVVPCIRTPPLHDALPISSNASASSYSTFHYTGGSASGMMTFTLSTPGTYVARAYYNWPSGGYTIQAQSSQFTVTAATPPSRSEEHTSELQSPDHLVSRHR